MNFVQPDAEELSLVRADPLLIEQELDVRPAVAESIERALGARAGRFYWRSEHEHLYAIELWDAGRGRPSSATIYGHWDRYEPRPPEHEIDLDLAAFLAWLAEQAQDLERADFEAVVKFEKVPLSWPEGSVLRTPDERFAGLPDFPYEPRYVDIEGLRMAWVEQGEGDPILMLHGEPTWGFLYRHMIPPLAPHGRVIVPDLIGFGRSDKPILPNAYTYRSQARRVRKFIEALDLRKITLVCQDWGGLIGLRILSQLPERFARLVAMNTGIPAGVHPGAGFSAWLKLSQSASSLDVGRLVSGMAVTANLSKAEQAAYDAPFPSPEYQTGAITFPPLVPLRENQLAAYENRQARERLQALDLPVYLPFGTKDPVTGAWGKDLVSLFKTAGAVDGIETAGHFIQEDAGAEVAARIVKFLAT